MTNNEIQLKVNEVLSKYLVKGNCHKILQDIIKAENIKFREVNSKNNSFVGSFTKAVNSQKYIMINSNIDNFGRKNFTIAHELGHYFLNHSLKQNDFYCIDNEILEDGSSTSEIEKEANYFATCLLMPEEKITNAFKALLSNSKKTYNYDFLLVKNSNYSVWKGICDTLTKRYGVSEAALRYRLKSLNLADFRMS